MDRPRSRRRAARTLRFESVESRLLLSADWSGLDRVRAEYGLTGQGQTVAVIDSGIAYRHSALGGGLGSGYRVVGGYDFAEQEADPYDDGPRGGHGTNVAGIIGSSDAAHLGVAPGVDLVALRVLDDAGQGSLGRVEKALEWVHAHRNDYRWPITTVNVSLGAATNSGVLPGWESLENAIAQLEADGIFVSIAAGNGFRTYNQPGVNYPAGSPHAVPVASADTDGTLSYFSQRDSRCLVAPGRGMASTVPDYDGNDNGVDDDFAYYAGTSMAAGWVSGASVLLREACELAGVQNVSQQYLYDLMVSTADTIRDPATGRDYHRINLDRAVDSIMSADDFGSSEAAAFDLGAMSATRTVSGRLERQTDADWFRFTAAQTGKVTLTFQTTGELKARWQLPAALQGIAPSADGALTLSVVAGQKYTFGLSSRSSVGNYVVTLHLTPAAPPADPIGTTVQRFDGVQVDIVGRWFPLTAAADGRLSIEASFSNAAGDVDLQLFDAAGRLLASSATTGDKEQIEIPATAGTKFFLRAFTYPGSGANQRVDFRVTNSPSQSVRNAAVDRAIVFGPWLPPQHWIGG